MTPAETLQAAADKLWDTPSDPDAELMSIGRNPRSWSILLATTAREMEQAAGTAQAARGDGSDPLRWRQALSVAREVLGEAAS